MKVTFRQTGGFAGLSRGCELDTEELPPAEAAKFEALVAASGLTSGKIPPPPAARDLQSYEIRVESDAGEVAAVFDDASVPEGAEELIAFLRQRSGPRPLT